MPSPDGYLALERESTLYDDTRIKLFNEGPVSAAPELSRERKRERVEV